MPAPPPLYNAARTSFGVFVGKTASGANPDSGNVVSVAHSMSPLQCATLTTIPARALVTAVACRPNRRPANRRPAAEPASGGTASGGTAAGRTGVRRNGGVRWNMGARRQTLIDEAVNNPNDTAARILAAAAA